MKSILGIFLHLILVSFSVKFHLPGPAFICLPFEREKEEAEKERKKGKKTNQKHIHKNDSVIFNPQMSVNVHFYP